MTDGQAVLVMTKAPRPGLVKTRLAPLLGDKGCASLQASLVSHAVEVAVSVSPTGTFVAFDPPDARGDLAALVPAGVRLLPQRGSHLGERMAAAVADVQAVQPGRLVVVGTDIPGLQARHLRDAFAAVAGRGTVVLGPALDGGYYLAGMSRHEPSLFDIPPALWGGPCVLAATAARAEAAGLQVRLLEALRDLDTVADAVALALADDPTLPPSLRSLLGALAERGRLGGAAGQP